MTAAPEQEAAAPGASTSAPAAQRSDVRAWRDLLWLAPWVAVLCTLFVRYIRSADFWWHLAAGRWIDANGAIPRTDPFSFTAGGQPWHYVSWPAEWLLYQVWALGGVNGVIGLRLLCVGATLTVLGLVARRVGASALTTAALLLAVAVVVQPRYTLDRPMLQGAVLLAATLWVSTRWWGRGGWSVLWVPAITALWLPTHGAGVVGVAAGMGAGASAALFARRRAWLLPGGVTALLSVALLVGTIAGREILEHLFLLGDASNVTGYIQEWGEATLRNPAHRLPIALMALGGVSAVVNFRRAPLVAGASLLGVYLGTQHVRGLTEGVLLTLPATAMLASQCAALFERRGAKVAARVVPAALVTTLVAAHFAQVDQPLEGLRGVGIDERMIPSDSVDVLHELPPGRVLNNMAIGGYLIWREVPGGVFVDGRILAVYTAEQFDRWVVPTLTDAAGIDRVADELDIDYAVASHVSVTSRLLMRSRAWVPVFHGLSTTVYVRRALAPELEAAGFELLDDLRYDLDRAWMDRWYDEVLGDPARRARLEAQIERGLTVRPLSPVAAEVAAYLEGRE